MSDQVITPTRKVITAADPMPAVRSTATDQVNRYFNDISLPEAQRDAAHAAKRVTAEAVAAGAAAPTEFAAEATLRGIAPPDLATIVLSKPDNAAERELSRQTTLLKIASAAMPADVEAILANVKSGI